MRDPQRPVLGATAAVVTCLAGMVFHTRAAETAAAVMMAVAAVAGVALMTMACRHHRVTAVLGRACRAEVFESTLVQSGTIGRPAVVAGLVWPKIYLDRDLLARLTTEQARAVILHERGHQRARDPLRLVVLAVVRPLLARCGRGRQLVERLVAEREILADRHALAHGVTRAVLAGALLNVAASVDESPRGGDGTVGFDSAVQLRVRALLGEEVCLPTVSGLWLAAGVAAGVLWCLSGLEWHLAVVPGAVHLLATVVS